MINWNLNLEDMENSIHPHEVYWIVNKNDFLMVLMEDAAIWSYFSCWVGAKNLHPNGYFHGIELPEYIPFVESITTVLELK